MLRALPFTILLLAVATSVLPADGDGKKDAKEAGSLPEVELRFVDGSTARVSIIQASIEFEMKYGKLTIPCADIRKIEVGFRTDEGTEKRIREAIKQLGSDQFQQREAASKELLQLAVPAYPILKTQLASKDLEVVRRCEAMLTQMEKSVPINRLQPRRDDLIQTVECSIPGRITTEKIKVRNKYFGETELRFSELRSLQSSVGGATGVTAPFADKTGLHEAAYLLEQGDFVGAKKAAETFAKGKSVEELARLFRLRTRGGLGIGQSAGAVQPDGIESLLNQLENARTAVPKALEAYPDDVARAFYLVAAIAEAHRGHCPIKQKKGKQDPKDWEKWSVALRDTALEMTAAVKEKQLPKVRAVATKLNNVCSSCHDVFRECN